MLALIGGIVVIIIRLIVKSIPLDYKWYWLNM